MKKAAIILFVFFAGKFLSQENLFQKIKEEIKKNYPELKLENKLIMINTWSVNDLKSREANAQLNKALVVYGGAKLKGGPWGIIGVLICKDGDLDAATVTLSKDKIDKPLNIKQSENLQINSFTNIVYDSGGKEINKNIASEKIYESIHQLITR